MQSVLINQSSLENTIYQFLTTWKEKEQSPTFIKDYHGALDMLKAGTYAQWVRLHKPTLTHWETRIGTSLIDFLKNTTPTGAISTLLPDIQVTQPVGKYLS